MKNSTKKENLPEQNAPVENNDTEKPGEKHVGIKISPPNIAVAAFVLQGGPAHGGTALGICRFSQKAQEAMAEVQKAGTTSRSRRNRPPKDFELLFKEAQYISREGWNGIHAAALRNAMISACRLVEFKMVLAKMGIFIEADGFDKFDNTPLLRIWGPNPQLWVAPVRNANGSFDLRPRPRWEEWELRPRIRYDNDMFTLNDITNLVARVGFQVGLGEGRPDSKNSAGLEMGLFTIATEAKEKAA